MSINKQQLLREAQIARHKLMTGTLVVELEIEGQKTRFNQAKLKDLEDYIASLEAEMAGKPKRGAIGIIF